VGLGTKDEADPDVEKLQGSPIYLECAPLVLFVIAQRRAKGVSMKTTIEELAPYMRGWRSYFGFCETPEVPIGLTRWVRLRLRAAMWRQWKTPRRRRAALLELGVRERLASNTAQWSWPLVSREGQGSGCGAF
jgi:hypothetical protein